MIQRVTRQSEAGAAAGAEQQRIEIRARATVLSLYSFIVLETDSEM
jgi:hypothetical protein